MDYDQDDNRMRSISVLSQFCGWFFWLFRRIILGKSATPTDVGSSIDLETEDIATWEQELKGIYNVTHLQAKLIFFRRVVLRRMVHASTSKQPGTEEELTPIDLDDEELAAYAEECAQRAVLAHFDDIPEELFIWSGFSRLPSSPPSSSI